jgi:hypothetical protein
VPDGSGTRLPAAPSSPHYSSRPRPPPPTRPRYRSRYPRNPDRRLCTVLFLRFIYTADLGDLSCTDTPCHFLLPPSSTSMAASNVRPWQRIVEEKRKLREVAIQSFVETHQDPPEVPTPWSRHMSCVDKQTDQCFRMLSAAPKAKTPKRAILSMGCMRFRKPSRLVL